MTECGWVVPFTRFVLLHIIQMPMRLKNKFVVTNILTAYCSSIYLTFHLLYSEVPPSQIDPSSLTNWYHWNLQQMSLMEKNCSITVLAVLILTTYLPLSANLILTTHVYFVAVQDIITFTHVSQSILNPESKCYHHYHMPGDWNKIKSSLISGWLPQMVTN